VTRHGSPAGRSPSCCRPPQSAVSHPGVAACLRCPARGAAWFGEQQVVGAHTVQASTASAACS
jgi:hypothetical protein